jgi:hypothetical protein
MFAALAAVAVVLFWQGRSRRAGRRQGVETGRDLAPQDDLLAQAGQRSPAALLRESEELARAGRFLEALRLLYLGVLVLLHRGGLIRYEPTRTNGEYARQLKGSEDATELYPPFRRLTTAFEVKWYGERTCDAADYNACRRLADEIAGRGPT